MTTRVRILDLAMAVVLTGIGNSFAAERLKYESGVFQYALAAGTPVLVRPTGCTKSDCGTKSKNQTT